MKLKKTAAAISAAAVLFTAVNLGSCGGKRQSDRDVFIGAPSAVSGVFSDYFKSAEKMLLKPSADASAESLLEYTYKTDDGPVTESLPLTASFSKADGALSFSFGGISLTFGKTPAFNGAPVENVFDPSAFDAIVGKFISDFCAQTEANDFESAPDSIRASDTDVEVTRYTLKLDRERYLRAFDRALSGLDANRGIITDILGVYAFLHGGERDGEGLFGDLVSAVRSAVEVGGERVVWQRYVRADGRTAAARIKTGDSLLRYICAESDTYKEIELHAELGGRTFELAYEKRLTGMEDSYNVRITDGDEITYFDGETSTAYKSGAVKFELIATKNARTVNGLNLTLDFNGVQSLSYKGSGNIVRLGDRREFSFTLGFGEGGAETKTPAKEKIPLYRALEEAFGK